jgi:hypothetical protein
VEHGPLLVLDAHILVSTAKTAGGVGQNRK